MNFQIDPGPEPEPSRNPVRPPPDYTSFAFRARLGLLVGSLLLVLILMQEARKPENWEWMGFQRPAPPAPPENPPVDPPALDQAIDRPSEQANRFLNAAALPGDSRVPNQAALFWQQELSSASQADQQLAFRILRWARSGAHPPAADVERCQAWLDGVTTHRETFHADLLESVTWIESAEQKERLAGELADSRSFWRERIQPALEATVNGEEMTIGQLQAVEWLQEVWDAFAWSQVEDGSALNRSAEGIASLRLWERALAADTRPPRAVTSIQLAGQPTAYRGERVAVEGWVRQIEYRTFGPNELGLDHVHILWLRPADSSEAPICVYAQDLPAEFSSEPLPESLNEHVRVEGVFYKIRSYTAADQTVRECPLLYAETVQPIAAETESPIPVDRWQPPTWLLVLFFLAMPLVATWVAVRVYRNTATRKFVAGARRQRQIEDNLSALADDSEIQTDRDRIREWERRAKQGDAP